MLVSKENYKGFLSSGPQYSKEEIEQFIDWLDGEVMFLEYYSPAKMIFLQSCIVEHFEKENNNDKKM